MKPAKGRAQAKSGPDRGKWKRWPWVVPPLLLLAVVLAVNFLGGASAPKAGGVAPAPVGGPSPFLTASRAPAPDFSVATTSGSQFRLADQKGEVVVVLFTAPG